MPFRERLYHSKTLLPSKHGGKVDEVVFNKSLLKPLKDYRWLNSRGISTATIESPLFQNCIKQVRSGKHMNTAFPYRIQAAGEIVGAEIRNHAFKGHMTGSQRSSSIWFSELIENCQRIIICESALDALSHYQLTKENNSVYISFGGQLTKEQIRAIQELREYLFNGSIPEMIVGVDNDSKGESYVNMLMNIFPESQRILPAKKDFNETLVGQIQRRQTQSSLQYGSFMK